MIYIRSFIFNVLYIATYLIILIPGSITLLLERKYSYHVVIFLEKTVMFLMKYVAGIKYEVKGLENHPNTPCIIASKHQSAWDTNLFVLLFDCISVVKKELTKIPFYGWYLRKWGTVAVDRKRGTKALGDMIKQAQHFIALGHDIMIFPEGSRTTPGERVEYKRGIAMMYAKLNVPVVPVALNSGCFWPRRGFLKYPGTITVQFLKPIPPGLSKDEFMIRLVESIENTSLKLYEEAKCVRK